MQTGNFCTRDFLISTFVRLSVCFRLYHVALAQAERLSILCDVSVWLVDTVTGVVWVEVAGITRVADEAILARGLTILEVTGVLLSATRDTLTGSSKWGIGTDSLCCNGSRALGTGIAVSVLSFKTLVPALCSNFICGRSGGERTDGWHGARGSSFEESNMVFSTVADGSLVDRRLTSLS